MLSVAKSRKAGRKIIWLLIVLLITPGCFTVHSTAQYISGSRASDEASFPYLVAFIGNVALGYAVAYNVDRESRVNSIDLLSAWTVIFMLDAMLDLRLYGLGPFEWDEDLFGPSGDTK